MGTLPLVLIPQITFGGLLVKVKHMGAMATVLSYGVFVRYSFEAMIKTGEKLSEVSTAGGGTDRVDRGTNAVLYILGFKTTASADDVGIPLTALLGVLGGSFVALLILTWIFTRRSREGN